MSVRRLGSSRTTVARLSGNTYRQAVLADSPWGFWRDSETSGTTFADSSGNARNMTITGTAATLNALTGPHGLPAVSWASGVSGEADTSAGFTIGAAVSCEAWVRLAAVPSSAPNLLIVSDSGQSSYQAQLAISTSGVPSFYVYDGSGKQVNGSALTLNTWHHIVGTAANGGQLRLYVDGGLVNSYGSNLGTVTSITQPVRSRSGGQGACSLSDLAIYSTELSAAQVAAHYQAIAG